MLFTDCTDHPDHDVGEPSDPDGGGEEGDHEPSLPAALRTVGHSEEQKQGQRPHDQPLQLVTRPSWRERETERERMTCSKGMLGGIKHRPLQSGHTLLHKHKHNAHTNKIYENSHL